MLSLNLPAFDAKIAARNGKNVIFDIIRRRYVALTPEEWVRQHFVHFLLAHKGYPQALMANEVQVQLNGVENTSFKAMPINCTLSRSIFRKYWGTFA